MSSGEPDSTMAGVRVTDWEWRIAGSASKMARIAGRMDFRIVEPRCVTVGGVGDSDEYASCEWEVWLDLRRGIGCGWSRDS